MNTSTLVLVIATIVMAISGVFLLTSRLSRADALEHERKRSLVNRYATKMLLRGGISPKKARPLFWSLKVSTGLSSVSATNILLQPESSTYLVISFVIGFWLPDAFLWFRFKQRQERIIQHLPTFCQFLISYMRAGLNFRTALQHALTLVTHKSNPLYEELQLVQIELDLGREQFDSFTDLALRTGVRDLKRLAVLLGRSELTQLGLLETLSIITDELANKQADLSEKEIAQKNFSLMIPMALITLPLLIVITLVPSALQILEVLNLMSGGQ